MLLSPRPRLLMLFGTFHLFVRSDRVRPLLSVLLAAAAALAVPVSAFAAAALTAPAPAAAAAGAAHPAGTDTFTTQIRPALEKNCFTCHGAQNASAGVNLSAFPDSASVRKDPATWNRVLTQLQQRTMPPAGVPHPSPDTRQQIVDWLTHTLNSAEEGLPANPGRVVIHRLSRTEYNNTIRDLLGVDTHPADDFPADGGGGGGFDNNADTLFLPPILMERYLSAATAVLAAARPERIFFKRPGNGVSPEKAARYILTYFVSHAYRRPARSIDLNRLMALYETATRRHESFESAVKLALKAILISPEFLFRVEHGDGAPGMAGPSRLTDYELASRLSYFLWGSMPDDELFQIAGQGRLSDPAVMDHQVWRMLQDPKARSFADSFAGQWLHVRELYTTALPDPGHYPDYNPALRDAMYNETVDYFYDTIHTNSSLLNLLDSDYTFLNETLARHYGIPGVTGAEMRRVRLPDHRRGGVITMAGVLTVTSYPERTSPVLRGKWVLEAILGTIIPPPPPDAGGLSPNDAPEAGLTFRQRLEKHRSKPQCASCHSKMDPLGFGLENFDGDGRWRTAIGGAPVDSSGVLANGEKFSGPVELKHHLLEDKHEFARNMVEKMLSYALGRGLEDYDVPTVNKITAAVESDGFKSLTLIDEVVNSYPFRNRMDEAIPPPEPGVPETPLNASKVRTAGVSAGGGTGAMSGIRVSNGDRVKSMVGAAERTATHGRTS